MAAVAGPGAELDQPFRAQVEIAFIDNPSLAYTCSEHHVPLAQFGSSNEPANSSSDIHDVRQGSQKSGHQAFHRS